MAFIKALLISLSLVVTPPPFSDDSSLPTYKQRIETCYPRGVYDWKTQWLIAEFARGNVRSDKFFNLMEALGEPEAKAVCIFKQFTRGA